jgi:hypothetical protein
MALVRRLDPKKLGPDTEQRRSISAYVGRIHKGESPGD